MSYNYPNNQPWDDRVYETGRTRPRKSRGGAIAVLLILVIFLSGVTCVLGFLNFRLFRQLNAQERKQENTHITFSNIEENPTERLDPASLDNHSEETLPQKEAEKDSLPLRSPRSPAGQPSAES